MCYNLKYTKEKLVRYATKRGLEVDPELFKDYHYVSGFSHPDLPVVTAENPSVILPYKWGLIPFWVKNHQLATDLSRKTLNAVGETMYEKSSFRTAAVKRRCLIVIDGFYEYHHHHGGQKVPYFIFARDKGSLTLGGLWESWNDKEADSVVNTVTILTSMGNNALSRIHNNPEVLARIGARMPVVIPEHLHEVWLSNETPRDRISEMIVPYPDEFLSHHTVAPLQGKEVLRNRLDSALPFSWNLDDLPFN